MQRFASVALATLLLIGGIAGFATASVAATGVNDEYENNDEELLNLDLDLDLNLDLGEENEDFQNNDEFENNEEYEQNEDDGLLGLF